MVGTIGVIVAAVLSVWFVAFLHELGHYYTARQIVGISGSNTQFVSLLVPRYVALRGDEGWSTPSSFQTYRETYEQYDPSYEHFERFVAGGEMVQALVVVPTAIVVALGGFERISAVLLGASVATVLAYVARDAILTRRASAPSGHYSALWKISPRIPFVFLLSFLFLHLGALYFVL